jgi:hypothetical protein
MGAVRDRLDLTLAEARNYLRVDDDADNELIESLIATVLEKADEYLGNDFDRVYRGRVGRGDGVLTTFALPVADTWTVHHVYVGGHEVGFNTDLSVNNNVVLHTVADYGAVIEADYDAPNLPIPSAIKTWCLSMIARLYEHRTNGVSSEAVSGVGSVQWTSEDFGPISHWRSNPGF